MNSLLHPDPPGTINPARLAADAWSAPHGLGDFGIPGLAASERTQISPEAAVQSIPSAPPTSMVTASAFPRLTRISSDRDPDDVVPTGRLEYGELSKDFEKHLADRPHLSVSRQTYISHHGYFSRQTPGGAYTFVTPDPDAGLDASVVVDKPTASIYDAFLLRSDITKNVNLFYRQQVVFDQYTRNYTFLAREGRVGLPSKVRQRSESADLKSLTEMFRKEFRSKTGLTWRKRYDFSRLGSFNFVELDYRWSAARQPGQLPNYGAVDANTHEELRELMEVMLYYGSSGRGDTTEKEPQGAVSGCFSAPYEYLSSWTVFLGFKTLQRISRCLESDRPVCWNAILRASSLYRSQIPFCAGENRVPVISGYHAIFLELKFLHSLWPRREIAGMLCDIHRRGSLQLRAHKVLAQPLYRAYASLRHGFRRLADSSTLEFQELKNYLERSCHRVHRLRFELRDIYRVFIKAGLPNPYRDWMEGKQGYDVSGDERLLLWHGTPLDSLLGILDLGLQIRRRGVTWTGTMFGNGIYFADASSKSATFCKHQWWGEEAVLLLCEVDVGRYRYRGVSSMQNGHNIIGAPGCQYRSVEGLGRFRPGGWKDVGWDMSGAPNSGVVRMPDTSIPYLETPSGGILGFNEYVVYDPSHVLIRYMFRLKIRFG